MMNLCSTWADGIKEGEFDRAKGPLCCNPNNILDNPGYDTCCEGAKAVVFYG
jgi:hypothetical protein